MKRITLLSICVSFSLVATVITRDNMISTASQYVPPINSWTPVVDSTAAVSPTWHSWYKTAKNGGAPPYNKLAYCWSGFDTPSEIKSRAEDDSIPAGGYMGDEYGYCREHIAGIDCSGFVLKCWGFSTYTSYKQLINNSLQIEASELKKGDLLRKPKHSALYMSGDYPMCRVYESQADDITSGHPPYPGVYYGWVRSFHSYTPLSIFPQFSDESPGDGGVLEDSQTVDISLIIKASGELVVDGGVNMTVNGQEVSSSLQSQGSNEWKLKAEDYNVSEGGRFDVRVIARNDISGNGYLDEYEWEFIVNQDSTPPMVVSTNPSDRATDVPVDIDPISIAFSKAMDHWTTEGAVSIEPSISYTTSWTNEDKTLNLHPDYYFDYFKEYTVTILEAATDTFGIHLDADGDGILMELSSSYSKKAREYI